MDIWTDTEGRMMKVNLSKEACGVNEDGSRVAETVLGTSLLNMMSVETADIFKHFHIDTEKGKPHIVDVECTVNGVSVDLRELIDHFWSSYQEDVNKRARELIEEKCSDVENVLSEINRIAKDRFPVRENW